MSENTIFKIRPEKYSLFVADYGYWFDVDTLPYDSFTSEELKEYCDELTLDFNDVMSFFEVYQEEKVKEAVKRLLKEKRGHIPSDVSDEVLRTVMRSLDQIYCHIGDSLYDDIDNGNLFKLCRFYLSSMGDYIWYKCNEIEAIDAEGRKTITRQSVAVSMQNEILYDDFIPSIL